MERLPPDGQFSLCLDPSEVIEAFDWHCNSISTHLYSYIRYAPEAAHPYYVLTKAGYEITFASPAGGKAPLDPASVEGFKEDEEVVKFLNTAETQKAVSETYKLSDMNEKVGSLLGFP
jgi:hypothetical protein